MLRSPLLCQRYLPKSFKQIEFGNKFGLFSVIDVVVNLRNWKCVCFGDRIYFTGSPCTCEMSHRVLVQEYNKNLHSL